MDDAKVRVTIDEGQTLLRISSSFGLPQALGDGPPYNASDRAIASEEVRCLYRELKKKSPLLSERRRLCFGSIESWRSSENEQQWFMVDPDCEVEISLSEDALWGVYWCLLMALHPSSPIVMGAGTQEDTLWPLAKKAKLEGRLRKVLGIETVERKRLSLDLESEKD